MSGGYLTNQFAHDILEQITGDTPAIPTWVSLLEADPTPAGTAGMEFAGNGYTRKPAKWTAPGNRTTALAAGVTFDAVPDGTIRWFGVHDAAAGGSMLIAIQKTTALGVADPLVVASNQEVTIPATDLVIGPL